MAILLKFYVNSRLQVFSKYERSYMRIYFLSLLTFLLGACNPDIFVDDFTPDVSELVMDGAGDSRTIDFQSADWSYLSLSSPYGFDDGDVMVTPEGGVEHQGKTLTGNGTITVRTVLANLTVARRGRRVTVDVDYAIGEGSLRLYLTAGLSDDVYCEHSVMLDIERTDGLEIVDVDYTLDTWFSDPGKRTTASLAWYGHGDNNTEPAIWRPKLDDGMRSICRMSTYSGDGAYLAAMAGMTIPIPTRTEAEWSDWELRGETAAVSYTWRDIKLMHYPPFPQIIVNPGILALLQVEMEPCGFMSEITLRNKITGEESVVPVTVEVLQPDKYIVVRDEI